VSERVECFLDRAPTAMSKGVRWLGQPFQFVHVRPHYFFNAQHLAQVREAGLGRRLRGDAAWVWRLFVMMQGRPEKGEMKKRLALLVATVLTVVVSV